MANNVQIKVDNKQALASLRKSLYAVRNMKSAMEKAARFIEMQIDQGFINQRDPYGVGWLPLKDTTLRLRQLRGNFSSVVLQDSGNMRESLDATATSKTVVVKMDDFSGIHQTGNQFNRMFGGPQAPVPMRRIFPIIDDQVIFPLTWEEEITSYFDDLIKDASNARA